MILVLGNRNAVVPVSAEGGGSVSAPLPEGNRATHLEIPDEYTSSQIIHALTDPDGVIANHFEQGSLPAWVACDDPKVADLLSSLWDGVEVRELETDDNGASE